MALTDKLTAIADAIRDKTGKAEEMTLDQMATEIAGIEAGGGVSEQEIIDKMASNLYPEGHITINSDAQVGAFARKEKITSVHIKGSLRRGENLFQLCTGLKKAEIECVDASMAYNMFNGCTALEYVIYRPSAATKNMFSGCTALKRFEGGSEFNNFQGFTIFNNCTALKHIILRQLTTMTNSDCFNKSSISSGGSGCNIYIPSELIAEQRAMTNWAAYDAYGTITWKVLEDYTVDGTSTGEIDWAKIEAEEVSA